MHGYRFFAFSCCNKDHNNTVNLSDHNNTVNLSISFGAIKTFGATIRFIKLRGCTISDTAYKRKIDNSISYHASQVQFFKWAYLICFRPTEWNNLLNVSILKTKNALRNIFI